MRKYFGTDGIRGQANRYPMTPDIALKVGMAVGTICRKKGQRPRVVIGKDTRRSSYMIENALVAGFTSAGVDVLLLGPIPTPAVAMLCRSMRAAMGIMISASHNPYFDNGIKIFGPDGYKLSESIEKKIEKLIDSDLQKQLAINEDIGRAKRVEGDIYRYIEAVKHTIERHVRFEGMRIVIDCANGAAYKAAPLALWELGAEVVTINNTPNGININQECGSTHPWALINKVKEVRADIGFALDGDGDRLLVVDETGKIIDGDQIMALVASNWLEQGRLRGGGIVGTIMSNLGLEHFLASKNLQLIRTQVGDRYVMEHMRTHDFNLGGEQSGHIIFADYNSTGDGLISALQLLNIAQQKKQKISQLCHCFEPVPQFLKNVRVKNKKILEQDKIQQHIREIEQKLANKGRIIIRPSGTEPVIRIMAEGPDSQELEELVENLAQQLQPH